MYGDFFLKTFEGYWDKGVEEGPGSAGEERSWDSNRFSVLAEAAEL